MGANTASSASGRVRLTPMEAHTGFAARGHHAESCGALAGLRGPRDGNSREVSWLESLGG